MDYAKSKGIHVINTPASSSESVAELVLLTCFQVFVSCMILTEICLEGDTNFDGLKKHMQMVLN
jgi:D-3-phosphoglycerate dehydrogenase